MNEPKRTGRMLPLTLVLPILALGASTAAAAEPDRPQPEVRDNRLELELFAEHPDIVTPTGLAVNEQGRVLVLESHTHKRPDDYDGPPRDRILMFEDTDGDGSADRRTVFHEGLTHAMQLAIHPDGSLYAATRNKVLRLRDTDGDRVADESELIVNMETPAEYPHNGLSGMAFAFDGDLYLGLGENRTRDYELTGSDGHTLSGGEGIGRVFRCEADGSKLRRVARGLWNPYGLTVDGFGRVFATENDPGDRPPCRLLHIVPGGNYGYQRRYQAGLHVFNAWEGELPGTLPMASGTAEAPTGILAYGSDALPREYRGTLLMGSWSDHRIERHTPNEHGASVKAKRETIVEGGGRFRPTGIDTAPDGTVYFSDWVSPSYPVHGHGRIWRLKPKETAKTDRPGDPKAAVRATDRATREAAARKLIAQGDSGQAVLRKLMTDAEAAPEIRATAVRALAAAGDEEADYRAVVQMEGPAALRARAARAAIERGTDPAVFLESTHPPAVRAEALYRMRLESHRSALLEHLSSDDPFLRTAAIEALSQSPKKLLKLDWSSLEDPMQRVGILLALKRTGLTAASRRINAFLNDPAEPVRFMAVKWIADETITEYRPELEKLLNSEGLTLRLFRGVSAALNRLAGRPPTTDLPPNRLFKMIVNENASLQRRRLALRLIDPGYGKLTLKKLQPLLSNDDPELRLEAIRTLQRHPDEDRFGALASIASDEDRRTIERAEAIVGLSPKAGDHAELLMGLSRGDEPTLRREALRALVGVELSDKHRAELKKLAEEQPALAEPIARVLGTDRPSKPAPTDLEAWIARIEQAGDEPDPEAGRRVFFNPKIGTCASCHEIDGRGTRVGPNLTQIHRSADRERLLESILQPGRELAPQFQPWEIRTTDGETRVGLPLRKSTREIYRDRNGNTFAVPLDEIESKRELSTSLMPPGLPLNMTARELRDLLAYLQQER